MPQRIDRVVRKGYEGEQFVYSLVLDEYGLYIVHTGNVGGLVTDHGDVHVNSDDSSDATFRRQIADQEARLDSDALPVLVHSQHSAFVPLQQVTAVSADAEAEPPTLSLDTQADHYEFAFTRATTADVTALADALRARLGTDA